MTNKFKEIICRVLDHVHPVHLFFMYDSGLVENFYIRTVGWYDHYAWKQYITKHPLIGVVSEKRLTRAEFRKLQEENEQAG